MNQRWRDRRDSYRPAGETIQTARYEVAEIAGDGADKVARAFIERHHYSGTYPAARFRFGLYERGELVGVSVFSQPVSNAVITNALPCSVEEGAELGRFVLIDRVPGNGETWFLARCTEQLRAHGLQGFVSFSDPLARRRADGAIVFPGHVGTIYQASNAVYVGRGAPQTMLLLPDGRSFNRRSMQKIRARDRGWRYAVEQLVAAGAAEPANDDLCAWLAEWLQRVTRAVRHPGNHKYAFAVQRQFRRHLPAPLPYPKLVGETRREA